MDTFSRRSILLLSPVLLLGPWIAPSEAAQPMTVKVNPQTAATQARPPGISFIPAIQTTFTFGGRPVATLASGVPGSTVGFRIPLTTSLSQLSLLYGLERTGTGSFTGGYGYPGLGYPFMSGFGYGGGYGGGYGALAYGGWGMGYPMSGSTTMSAAPATTVAYPPSTATLYSAAQQQQAATANTVLAGLGVPNTQGEPNWPLGLQVLFPQKENLDLLDQIKATLNAAANQKLRGAVSPELIKVGNHALDRLEVLLHRREDALSMRDYRDAERFIDTLRVAFKAM